MQTIIYKIDKQQGPTIEPENYIQYPVINHKEKEYEKEYISESLCCTAEINNIVIQLYFNTIFKKRVYDNP